MTEPTTTPPASAPGPVLAADTIYEDDKALDVIGYLISLKRYLVPAAVVGALVLALGLSYALTRPDSYVARSTITLVPGAVSSEAEATQQAAMLPMVARNYSQLANSALVLDEAAKTVDPSGELKGSALADALKVGWPANSLMLNFDVTASSEQEALARARAITDAFMKHVPPTTANGGALALQAKVVYQEQGPLSPEPSQAPQLVAVSLVAAIAAALLVAVALDLTLGRRQRHRQLTGSAS